MYSYLKLISTTLNQGVEKETRSGKVISKFAQFYEIDLADGFPLLTTKKVLYKSVFLELLWYLRGEDHIRWLRDENDCHIWDAWADEDGYVGPIYPTLWRRFPFHKEEIEDASFAGPSTKILNSKANIVTGEVDQIKRVIESITTDPDSRRHVVSAWHPGLLEEQALPPCHVMFIFNVENGCLNCHLTQRSGDLALGIPFNIACYSALIHVIAKLTGLLPGKFAHTIVDCHIYENHKEGLLEQLVREPKPLPTLKLKDFDSIDELTLDHFVIENYDPHPLIKFEVAV